MWAVVFIRGRPGVILVLMVMDVVVMVLVLVFVVVLVVVVVVVAWWYGIRKKGKGSAMTHLDVWMVTMASIITVWMMWHVATSSPFVVGVCSCSCGWPVMVVGGGW